jgi:RNA recognition motif-containing protein
MSLFARFFESLRRFFTGSGGGSTEEGGGSGHRIYVGNLSYQVKEDELRALFSKYGRIKSLHLIRDRITRRLKGYAFLEMSPEDAQRSLALNGTVFLDRKIVVSVAKAKKTGGRPSPRASHGNPRFRRRRNGPRAYGQDQKENTPIERLE